MEILSQRPLYSTDPTTKGFDLSSGNMWIYPENYPLREYQFEMVKSALYHNTLVCLPTGLGKTFIAAVVMYNFWRWYPQGKIIFLAPTKPLVAQQIEACHDIMGIPSSETVELTGTTDQKKRQVAWLKHRVIFATPQAFQKDLEKMIVPSERVKCVVIDEAHKALGRHSYCESIRLLSGQNQYFRVLALSATPGSKLDAVQEVVRNLHITHMELRDDKSPDILPYINERKVDIILVSLGAELEGFKERYITIMDRHVRVLIENNVLRGFTGNISKGRIFHLQKEWQQKVNKSGNHGQIMKTLTILMTMYHAYELMVRHGLRAFYNFYQNHMDKYWLVDEQELQRLLEEINYYLGPFPDVRPMPDGSLPEIPEDIRFGHKKFQKLKEVLLRHFERFENKEEDTRAIVFVEYRDIVNEVYVLLLQARPLIRPQKFVGQAGLKQKQQKLALENFRSNKVNVLISTSVGEEGLDVGEVDLIICFDISQQSPTRLVQRMGRTGRKRDGHIVVLVTDGKEHQTLKSTMSRRDSLNNKVLQSSGIINALHEESPRMVPAEFDPTCQKMVMTIVPKTVPTKGKKRTEEKQQKSRKPADASNKTKKAKHPVEASKSVGSQSSLMRFLKKSTEDAAMEVDNDFAGSTTHEIPAFPVTTNRTSQSSQQSLKNNNVIKLSDVKLLSSDNAAVEFLTLCTMKQSENEHTYIDKGRTNPYDPSFYTDIENKENFFDFDVPDLGILECLKDITECVVPSVDIEDDDVMICEPSGQFNGFNDFYNSPQNDIPAKESKFEALLDESSSDSDVTILEPVAPNNNEFPISEQVDWAENIDGFDLEDFIDDWSEESKACVGKHEPDGNRENEVPCQSPTDVLNEPGIFENILDSSSDESETDSRPQNTNINSKSQDNEVATKNPVEMAIDDESRAAFEDILNCSFDESDTDCGPQNLDVTSTISKEKATTSNRVEIATGNKSERVIEILLNSSSDEGDADCSLQRRNTKRDTPKEEPERRNKETGIENKSSGAFEEILNDDSETDCSLFNVDDASEVLEEKTTTRNNEAEIEKKSEGAFEDMLNASTDDSETDCSLYNVDVTSKIPEEKSTTRNNETSIDTKTEGAFEDMLNASTDDSETDCSLHNVDVTSKIPEEISATRNNETGIETKTEGAFEGILNSSSDDSETDCSIEAEPDVTHAPKEISSTKNPTETPNHSQLNSKQASKEKRSLRMSFDIEDNEFIYFPKDSEPKTTSQLSTSENDRPFAPLSNFPEPSTSFTPKISTQLQSSQLTVSQTLRKVEQVHSIKNIHNDSEVNNASKGETENERSASPVFPDRPRSSRASQLSGTSLSDTEPRQPERELILSRIVDQADDVAESEEDIFGTDDLLVDSDFEEEIKNIEKSAEENVNTDVREKLCETSAINSYEEEDHQIAIVFERTNSHKIVSQPSELPTEPSRLETKIGESDRSRNVTNEIYPPAATSFASELNLDDFEWESEETKTPCLQAAKESVPSTVDLNDVDWSTEEAKSSNAPTVNESILNTAELNDIDWEPEVAKDSTALAGKAEPMTDVLLDDYDWGSDFETSPAPLKASTSFQKIVNNRESPTSIYNSLDTGSTSGAKFRRFENTTGWKSTEKPKARLSLSSRLTNNIRKVLQEKRSNKKSPDSKQDSDSENDFSIGRLETTLTKQAESDFFAKPNPVDKLTRLKPLSMSNSRRIVERPLSLRRNDVNKLRIGGLSSFAAPKKYSQQQQTRDSIVVGAGRQKSASLDLDRRKRKIKRRTERKRVRVRSEFIDDEADVSTDEDLSAGSSGTDEDLADFVSYTQHHDESVDMQAHYLQTVRSPRRAGGFHLRKPKSPDPDLQIYSQALPDEPNVYHYDSFCVDENDEVFEESATADEISLLEEMEKNLRSKKRKRIQSEDTRANCKRRVIAPPTDTSSSEDEFEKLRREIHDESISLRKKNSD